MAKVEEFCIYFLFTSKKKGEEAVSAYHPSNRNINLEIRLFISKLSDKRLKMILEVLK